MYGYWSDAWYIVGREGKVNETGTFQVQVEGKMHLANIDDFTEISFAKNKGGVKTVSLESDAGVKTTGTLAIEATGDLFLVGGLFGEPRMKVAINLNKWKLRRDKMTETQHPPAN